MPVCILCMSVWYVMYWCYGPRKSTPQPSDEMTVFKETVIVYIAHPHSLVISFLFWCPQYTVVEAWVIHIIFTS